MPQGSIKKLVADRGFGFINTDRGDVFFHLSALAEGVFEDLQEGQQVEFETEDGPKGPRAVSVKIIS
jgi:CspA family cold shock protein